MRFSHKRLALPSPSPVGGELDGLGSVVGSGLIGVEVGMSIVLSGNGALISNVTPSGPVSTHNTVSGPYDSTVIF